MTTANLEDRIRALETEMARLKRMLGTRKQSKIPWWKRISGTFANEPAFEVAMRLGREYRDSFRPRLKRTRPPKRRHARA